MTKICIVWYKIKRAILSQLLSDRMMVSVYFLSLISRQMDTASMKRRRAAKKRPAERRSLKTEPRTSQHSSHDAGITSSSAAKRGRRLGHPAADGRSEKLPHQSRTKNSEEVSLFILHHLNFNPKNGGLRYRYRNLLSFERNMSY